MSHGEARPAPSDVRAQTSQAASCTWLRPPDLAWYSAVSASDTRVSAEFPIPIDATPALKRGRYGNLVRQDEQLRLDRSPEVLANKLGISDKGVRHEQRKLLATYAAHEIARSCRFVHSSSDAAQHLVAGWMAVRIIDPLNVINVEDRKR